VVKLDEVLHQVAIGGRVIEGGTKKPASGVFVSLTDMPPALKLALTRKSIQYGSRWTKILERPDRAITADDGFFYFLDLPDGKYTVVASLRGSGKRCGTAHATATVSRDAKGNLKMAFVEITLQPTTVQGRITGSGHKAGVFMAEVRIKGSAERTYSDAQGQFVLASIEPGRRTVMVFAQDYRAAAKVVTLNAPGSIETVNFALVREAG
jgi:hypothetical protein